MSPLCPMSNYGSPVAFLKFQMALLKFQMASLKFQMALLKFQMASRLILVLSSGSKKPRHTCLHEAKASHSHRMSAEVSSSAAHLLHNGLSDSPIRWRCLLRVLCPVRSPVTALDCVLLKDWNLALALRKGPETSSRACLRMSPRTRHHIQCRLTNQHLILLHISCLETAMAGSGPTNFRAQLSLASLLTISLPHTPACPGTQCSPTACRVDPQTTWSQT